MSATDGLAATAPDRCGGNGVFVESTSSWKPLPRPRRSAGACARMHEPRRAGGGKDEVGALVRDRRLHPSTAGYIREK